MPSDRKPDSSPESVKRVPSGGAPATAEAETTASEENLNVPPPLVEGDAFSGIGQALYDPPDSDTTLYRVPFLNASFAILSLVLLVLTVWAIYQDYDREWKHFQYVWQDHQAAVLRERLAKQEAEIQDDLSALETHIEEARSRIKHSELARLRREAEEAANKRDFLDTRVKFLKSEIAAERFVLEETKKKILLEHGDTEEGRRQLAQVEEEFRRTWLDPLERYQAQAEEAKAAAEAAKARVDAELAAITEAESKIQSLTRQKKITESSLAEVKRNAQNTIRNLPLLDFFKPSAKIHKVVLKDLTEPLGNFEDVARVDRCKSCHVNIDDPDPSYAAVVMADKPHGGKVYRSHPRLDLYVGSSSPHPYQDFGCTICHYGDGHSLTFHTTAHTPRDETEKREWEEKYHWHEMHHQDFPMIPMKYISATCAKCHTEESRIPSADRYNRGRELVEMYGCFGCHKIEGFAYRKVGPDLTHIAQKTSRAFLYKWIHDPSHFRPTTRMPRFFGLSNQQGTISVFGLDGEVSVQRMPVRNEVEALAISAYVHATSRERDDILPEPTLRGDVERGKKVFKESGCLGCHSIAREGWTENSHGPDLSSVGSKVNRRWLADWIVHPKKHFPKTRMPRLRIEQDENGAQKLADLVDYLMSLRDPAFEEEQAPPIDEERRRILKEIAFYHKTRTLTRTEAKKAIDEYYRAPSGLDGDGKEAALAGGDEALLVDVGEHLIRRYGCFGCHDGLKGFETATPIGTELSKHGVKPVDRLDFGQWGHQPTGEDAIPHSRIAWFTHKLHDTRIFDIIPVRKVDAEGNVVYEPSGDPEDWEHHPPERVQKTAEELLKMPLFPFHDNEEDIASLVTFLLSRRPDPIPLAKQRLLRGDAQDLEDGRRLVRFYNCQGCHRIGVDEQHIILRKRTGKPGDFPRFSVDDQDEALLELNEIEKETWLASDLELGDTVFPANTFISAGFKAKGPRGDEEDEYSVVEIAEHYWNTHGVPERNRVLKVYGYNEGRIRKYFGSEPADRAKAPPLLRLQGERVHGDWLFEFLLDVKPLRPWLTLRMPSFDMPPEQAKTIVAMFKVLSKTPYPYETFPEDSLDLQAGLEGAEIFKVRQPADEGKNPAPVRLGCQNCHPRGSQAPILPDPANWGPDLGLARTRLRPAWIRSWLIDPWYFMPGTNMPRFWMEPDIFGDPENTPPAVRDWVKEHMPALQKVELTVLRPNWEREMNALLQYLTHMPEVDGASASR